MINANQQANDRQKNNNFHYEGSNNNNNQNEKNKRKKQPPMYFPNTDLLKYCKNYFSSRKSQIPPLFLQHDGHSRTVIGYEERNRQIALIILDPGQDPEVLGKAVSQSSPQIKPFKKTIETFFKPQYQVIEIDPSHIMNEQESEKSKIMTTEKFF